MCVVLWCTVFFGALCSVCLRPCFFFTCALWCMNKIYVWFIMPYQMESATCAHQQNKIDTRRLHTGRIPIPNASLPNVCSFFSSVAPATIAAVPASSSSKSCILYLFVFSCRTYRRGRIPFDSTWKRNKRVFIVCVCVNNISLWNRMKSVDSSLWTRIHTW